MARLRPVSFEDRLTLVEHLDELRNRIIITLAAFAAAFGLCFWQNDLLLEIANEPLPAASEIYIAIGIGYGRVLLVGDDDAYGDEMNVACKLGEDLAEQGEILLTASAHEALGTGTTWQFEDSSVRISGLDLTAYKLVR